MKSKRPGLGWPCLVAGVMWFGAAGLGARAEEAIMPEDEVKPAERAPAGPEAVGPRVPSRGPRAFVPHTIPLDSLPAGQRETVRRVMEHPTLASNGPVEVFRGSPTLYDWLLDHPDRAVRMWRRLGARCMEITDCGGGRFGWTDGQGSEVHWEAVVRGPRLRVWYAEGGVRPDGLLPRVALRAVVVLRFTEDEAGVGRAEIRHQADLFLQTDSKVAALVARMLGPSAPRLAEQCVGQMELFFSALVWYLDRHPEHAEALLFGSLVPPPSAKVQ